MSEGQRPERRWLRGCAAGGVVALCMALAAGAVVYRKAATQLTETRTAMQKRFANEYRELLAMGKIPESERAQVEALAQAAQDEDAGVFGIAAISAVLRVVFDDCQVAPNEREMLNALNRMLEDNPAPSLLTVVKYREQFPEMQRCLEEGPVGK